MADTSIGNRPTTHMNSGYKFCKSFNKPFTEIPWGTLYSSCPNYEEGEKEEVMKAMGLSSFSGGEENE